MTAQTNADGTPEGAQNMEERLEAMATAKPMSFWRMAMIRLRRDKLTMAAFSILVIIALASIFAGPLAQAIGYGPDDSNILNTFAPPSADNWLGTDDLGRDQFVRLLYGGRISLMIGVFGTVFTLLFGITIGMVAAFFGKWVDDLIIYIINTMGAIPSLFLLLIIGSLWNLSPTWLALLFGLLGWPGIARLVRSQVFSLREQEYVIAARALGASRASIMFRHILPNVIPIVIIATARRVGILILSESGLSFLGFGVQPPTSTWGTMLTKAQNYILVPNGQHLVLAPGLMITLTVLCLYIIGDGLRDALDPRLR